MSESSEQKLNMLLEKAYDESIDIAMEMGDDTERQTFLENVCNPLSKALEWRTENCTKTTNDFVNVYLHSKKNSHADPQLIVVFTRIVSSICPEYRFGSAIDVDDYETVDN